MKKNVLKRTLAMLLVLATVLSTVPAGVLAAPVVGNITTDSYAGNTGIVNSSLGQDGYINWPIKIYDYLNDGMLFEPATAGVDDNFFEEYGGGAAVPVTTIGTDFTANTAYSKTAYASPGNDGSGYLIGGAFAKQKVSAVRFQSSQYLRLSKGTGSNPNYPLNYFTYENGTSYAKEKVRYIALVYRSKGIVADAGAAADDDRLQFNLQTTGGYYRATLKQGDSNTWVNYPDQWQCLIIDLQEAVPAWDDLPAISSVYFRCPFANSATGATFDISHIAYFASEVEAQNYGEAALAFVNNPGEHLKTAATITLDGGQPIYKEYDAADEPGYNLSPQNTTAPNTTSTSKVRFGLNFALGTGQNTTTYSYWKNRTSLTMYGTTATPFTPTQMTVKENNDTANKSYVTLSADSTSNFVLTNFSEQDANGTYYVRAQYAVLVYRAHGFSSTDDSFGFWSASYKTAGTGWGNDSSANYVYKGYQSSNWINDSNVCKSAIKDSPHEGAWVYNIVNLSSYVSGATYMKYLGMYLPTAAGKSLDLAYVAYFYDNSAATTFATAATAYMNAGLTYQDGYTEPKTATLSATRKWIGGSNTAFGLLGPSQFGGWSGSVGGANANTNGYHTYRIGESLDLMDYYYSTHGLGSANYNNNRKVSDNKIYYVENVYEGDINYVKEQVTKLGGVASSVVKHTTSTKDEYSFQSIYGSTTYFYYTYTDASGNTVKYLPQGYDMSNLSLDGYTLYNYVTGGKLTAGLLESGLDTTGGSRTPVYRQETVAYVAEMLYNTLTIAETDGSGNYHYNFIKGTASEQYGGFDLNGDGEISTADLDGDTHYETNEASVDLATALRYCLNIKFTYGEASGAFVARTDKAYGLGSYTDTLTRASKLKGTFKECRDYIYTCTDAAYFLLNNIFVENSYSQAQDEYQYLTLGKATLTDGGTAYVFDGGFASGGDMAALEAGTITQQEYMAASKNAVVYDKSAGTISIPDVDAKDLYYYGASTTSITTRFPFLPVTDGEGPYAGESQTYYFQDDGVRAYAEEYATYRNRNYNYVMASNGEFVYYEEEDLFFEFEGDDDVYLFINGQLVLDIGGAHSITKVKFNVNDYVDWARAEVESKGDAASDQAKALALTEGEICQFDFYYMERHGYGANCRIVTNMHVTDPNLKVEKSAQQFGEEVSYGGVVEPAAPVGYTFKLTNTGNTKLYNLTFTDDVIGVTLDPEKGLVIRDGWNGVNVFDSKGGTLEASDLSATVVGTTTAGVTTTVNVSFTDNQSLINFLKLLNAEGTESGKDNAEVTHEGSGLWVDSTVTITGMHYLMNAKQVEEGMVHNTVYVTATTKSKVTDAGNQTLRSDASHRIYTAGAPIYYQWAGHEIFLKEMDLLDDATREAGVVNGVITESDSQLSQYAVFFKGANNNIANIRTRLCDKKGNTLTYTDVTTGNQSDGAENWGFFINYQKSGSYTFYVLMYLKETVSVTNLEGVTLTGYASGTAIGDMAEGTYAIIPVTVTVADVEDSTFVLDYGLGTESLDMDGALFNQDELFGSSGSVKAKLMGVTTTEPKYLAPSEVSDADYNRIDFDTWTLAGVQKITPFTESGKADGVFNVNLNIPQHGHPIAYDSTIGGYTISGAGTMTINAEVPSSWTQVYLYYWYDGGETPVEMPGVAMEYVSSGKFTLDIPGNVTNVLLHDGNGQQTIDLHVTAGVESTIRLSTDTSDNFILDAAGDIMATVICAVDSTAYIKVPDWWGDVFLYGWSDDNSYRHAWPGVQVTQKNAEGYYVVKIPGDTSKIIVSNGEEGVALSDRNQTVDIDIDSGRDVWIETGEYIREVLGTEGENAGKKIYSLYRCAFTYSQDPVTIHAKVPSDWGSTVKLYAWYSGTENNNAKWPGQAMTLGEDGWYTLDLAGAYDSVIITDGKNQTKDLLITPDMETWIAVKDSSTVHAQVPSHWGSNICLYAWNSVSGAKNSQWPGAAMTMGADGWYALELTGDYDYVIINNGDNGKQTANQQITAGKETWITVNDTVTVHAEVPADWGSSINLYAWNGDGSNASWPGQAMTLGADGTYTLEIPCHFTNLIVNNGSVQTVDIENVSLYQDTWVTVDGSMNGSNYNAYVSQTGTLTQSAKLEYKYIADISYTSDGSKEGFTFTPTQIMSNKNVLWMAVTVHNASKIPSVLGNVIDINNEVQMFKKITVLPANVVYYEDDFSGITYNYSSTTNSFAHHGEGSGSLTQSVDQSTVYGSDPAYQSGTNALYSGDSLTKVQIKGTDQVAAFTFTGTGFEFISRTNAFDSATIVMKLYGTTTATDGTLVKNAEPLQNIPLITEFDNGNNGGTEEIYQVPALRVKDLAYGTYIVEISGNPAYDFSKWDGDINTINSCMLDTYLYIDGIRIYQPLGEADILYSASESGAVFKEFRDLIVEGKVAVADMAADGLQVSSGTTTWTENLLGDDFGENSAAFVGNKVDSADDYMIMGPNNEVYMDGTVSDTALAFYVAEDAAENHSLQIALRALDYGKFYAAGSTGPNVVVEYGVVLSDGTYVWRPLVNALSSTEQYYSIPYAQCPVVQDSEGNDCYQIALRAVNGDTGIPAMVSYTSMKLLGLTLQNVTGVGESTNLYYQDGILIKNQYYLCGPGLTEQLFDNGSLTVTLENAGYVYLKSVLGEKTTYYSLQSGNTFAVSEAAPTENGKMLSVSAGTVTFTLTDNLNDTVTLTYTGTDSGEVEGASEPAVTALNMVALQQQMQAKSLAAAQIEAAERVTIPGLEAVEASLSFDDEIHYNIYFTAENLTDVQELGLLLFTDRLTDGTFYDAAQVIPGYYVDGEDYMVRTDGIPAKNMGDTVYFKIYAKLTDGSYAYSDIAGYNAVVYAQSILEKSQNPAMKSLVVAMLNYGAEAQNYFGYNTDHLMNAGLTAEQQALVGAYDADLIAGPVAADSSKLGDFTATGGFTGFGASVVFEGAFAINYYVTPDVDVAVTMYYWSQADYTTAETLTADNATGVIPMTGETERYASVTGIAAKALEDTVYVAMVYEADGVRYCTGVKAYSLAAYCKSIAAKDGSLMQNLAKATAVYGYCAKQYFAQ